MFQLYTDDARRVLSVAQRHAARLRHGAVGIEHLALAVIEYGRGPVEEALFALNITPSETWTRWESLIGTRQASGTTEEQPPRRLEYTPGASHALGLTLREMRLLRHNYIGSEHILLAVLRHLDDPWVEPELAIELFERLGVDLGRLRQELLSRIPTDDDPPQRKQTGNVRALGVSPYMDWLAPP